MANGYMPRADVAALQWMKLFANGLVNQPILYGVTPTEAQQVHDIVDAFDVAYKITQDNATRTPLSIVKKDQARAAADAVCRVFYNRIKPNPAISDPDKFAIGVRSMNPPRSRIGVPQTTPALVFNTTAWPVHELIYSDSAASHGDAKPFGATQIQIYRLIHESSHAASTADLSAEKMSFVGCYSRNPIRLTYPSTENGKVVTYYARWMTRRGEVGPWSAPLDVPIFNLAPTKQLSMAA